MKTRPIYQEGGPTAEDWFYPRKTFNRKNLWNFYRDQAIFVEFNSYVNKQQDELVVNIMLGKE